MKYLTSTILFSVLLLSCQKDEWNLNQKEALMKGYIESGFDEKEAICTLDDITEKFSYSYFLEQSQKLALNTSDEKFRNALISVIEKCTVKGYTNSFQKRVTSVWINSSGLSPKLAYCLYEKIKNKYTYEEFKKLDSDAMLGKTNTAYLAFFQISQNECAKE